MGDCVRQALKKLIRAVEEIIAPDKPTVYLYGSCVLEDFRPGWSDIDLLILTPNPLTLQQAERLVPLRQELLAAEPGNPYARAFEGCVIGLEAFLERSAETAAYWGTSGERIRQGYALDCFCMKLLMEKGELICGEDVRYRMHSVTPEEIHQGVEEHLHIIRMHGHGGASLYTYGWLLDTARCLYTLRTGEIIAKTIAGEWALREGLCPDPWAMELALAARRDPAHADLEAAKTLGDAIQRFACVLADELLTH